MAFRRVHVCSLHLVFKRNKLPLERKVIHRNIPSGFQVSGYKILLKMKRESQTTPSLYLEGKFL